MYQPFLGYYCTTIFGKRPYTDENSDRSNWVVLSPWVRLLLFECATVRKFLFEPQCWIYSNPFTVGSMRKGTYLKNWRYESHSICQDADFTMIPSYPLVTEHSDWTSSFTVELSVKKLWISVAFCMFTRGKPPMFWWVNHGVIPPCEVLEEAGGSRGDRTRSYAADTCPGDGLQRHEQLEIVWKMVDES